MFKGGLSRSGLNAFLLICFGVLVFGMAAPSVKAEALDGGGSSSNLCSNANVLSGRLIDQFCWGCLFPIRLGGVTVGDGEVPSGANNALVCSCTDNNGLPRFGVGTGYWEPARLVELVRGPGCAPSLGGITLPGTDRRHWGTPGIGHRDSSDKSFYHYRYYTFPVMALLDLFTPGTCFTDGMSDFDLAYISELDPTWSDDELAFFTNPEAAAVANLPAQAACTADAAYTATGRVTDAMWWCAGSWGSLYPFSGHAPAAGMVRATSLLSGRAIAALHRRGLAMRTMGSDTMCRARLEPMMPKRQYRLNMYWPVAEANGNHVIGETTWRWGKGRMIPGVGEDAVYMVWRWNDCCNLY